MLTGRSAYSLVQLGNARVRKDLDMPRPPEDIRRRLDELIGRCDCFSRQHSQAAGKEPMTPLHFTAPRNEVWRFLISSLQAVSSPCGKESPHYRELERCRAEFVQVNGPGLDLDTCRGALEAARDDLDAGMLTDL